MITFNFNTFMNAKAVAAEEAKNFKPGWVNVEIPDPTTTSDTTETKNVWRYYYTPEYYFTVKTFLTGAKNLRPLYGNAEKIRKDALAKAFKELCSNKEIIEELVGSYVILDRGLVFRYSDSPAISGKLGARLGSAMIAGGFVPSAKEQIFDNSEDGSPCRAIEVQHAKILDLIKGNEIVGDIKDITGHGWIKTDGTNTWAEPYSEKEFCLKQANILQSYLDKFNFNLSNPEFWQIEQNWSDYLCSEAGVATTDSRANEDQIAFHTGIGDCFDGGYAWANQVAEDEITEHYKDNEYIVSGNTFYRTVFAILCLPEINPDLSKFVSDFLGDEITEEKMEELFELLQGQYIYADYFTVITNPFAKTVRAVTEKEIFSSKSAAKKLNSLFNGKDDIYAIKSVIRYAIDAIKEEGVNKDLPFFWDGVSTYGDADAEEWFENQKKAKSAWIMEQFKSRFADLYKAYHGLVEEILNYQDPSTNIETDYVGFNITNISGGYTSSGDEYYEFAADAISEEDLSSEDCPF